jgi:branched-subunit amino acid aminotransferase/4-amino-4-deoxychorismate lyase
MPSYALIETLVRERDGTLRHLEAHLARLRAAADDLHFHYDETALREALRAEIATAPIILRLQLERDGSFAISRRPLLFLAEPVALCWASDPLDANEPLLRYKTTWRPHYDAALADAERMRCFDAILCNTRGEIADGARSTLFLRKGDRLFTPPLESGALPGVLRGRMLASGAAQERQLTRSEVAGADDLYVGNSTRGVLRARFADRSGAPHAGNRHENP